MAAVSQGAGDLSQHGAPEAVIVSAEVVAGHDGSAELLVTLGYPNGATAQVALDERTGLALMAACGASQVEELAGQSWRRILAAG